MNKEKIFEIIDKELDLNEEAKCILDDSDFEHIDALCDKLIEYIDSNYSENFIYYKDAMEYLFDNDQTLENSLDLAYNCSLTLKGLDSIKLANLLIVNEMIEKVNELRDIIEDYL